MEETPVAGEPEARRQDQLEVNKVSAAVTVHTSASWSHRYRVLWALLYRLGVKLRMSVRSVGAREI